MTRTTRTPPAATKGAENDDTGAASNSAGIVPAKRSKPIVAETDAFDYGRAGHLPTEALVAFDATGRAVYMSGLDGLRPPIDGDRRFFARKGFRVERRPFAEARRLVLARGVTAVPS